MLAQRARDSLVAVAFCNLVGGQDELVFDGMSAVIDEARRGRSPAPPSSTRSCCSAPSTSGRWRRAPARRLAPRGGPARARRRAHGRAARQRRERDGRRGRERSGGRAGRAARPRSRDPRRAGHRTARLRRQERVRRGGARAVGRRRLGARRPCWPSTRSDPSACTAWSCPRAIHPLEHRRTREGSPPTSASTSSSSRSRRRSGPTRICSPSRSQAASPTSPRRTSRPASAGTCSWPCRTSSAGSCWSTGNKSELSVGYSTLYGDMAGGFAPIKDLFKGWVYRVLRLARGAGDGELLPPDIAPGPPSAELRPDQRDEDSLPPYDLLDRYPRRLRRGGPRTSSSSSAVACRATRSTG